MLIRLIFLNKEAERSKREPPKKLNFVQKMAKWGCCVYFTWISFCYYIVQSEIVEELSLKKKVRAKQWS